MPLDDLRWNLKVDGILGVHSNTVHQLIFVGELLVVKMLLQVVHSVSVEGSDVSLLLCGNMRS